MRAEEAREIANNMTYKWMQDTITVLMSQVQAAATRGQVSTRIVVPEQYASKCSELRRHFAALGYSSATCKDEEGQAFVLYW